MRKDTFVNLDRLKYLLLLSYQWDFKCIVCGEEITKLNALTIEHIIPKCKGGEGRKNLGIAHNRCNNIKGDKSLLVAARELKLLLIKKSNCWLHKKVPNRSFETHLPHLSPRELFCIYK